MEYTITVGENVSVSVMPTQGFVKTTTKGSESESIRDLTDLAGEQSGFTDSDSCLPMEDLEYLHATSEHASLTEYLAWLDSRTAEFLDKAISLVFPMRISKDGSTGLSPEEAVL